MDDKSCELTEEDDVRGIGRSESETKKLARSEAGSISIHTLCYHWLGYRVSQLPVDYSPPLTSFC